LTGVGLRWNYSADGVADDASLTVKVLGIEMVYIPSGSFYAGDNGYSLACFKAGSNDNSPWYITSENAINVTNTISGGYYYTNTSNGGTDENETGSTFNIPNSFPKGYAAIYCMKYEITQGQYASFLNLLNSAQAADRYDASCYNLFRYTITYSSGVYSTNRPDRACNYLSWADGCAYADWSGLRLMTELEYEKICRGPLAPVSGEYASGTTNIIAATTISDLENGTEFILDNGANCSYNSHWGIGGVIFTGGDGGQGPLRVGIFAKANTTREQSGATYYGVMEMSGNLFERCITSGNSKGRLFTGSNGDGKLNSSGDADIINCPANDALGACSRGGSFDYGLNSPKVSIRNLAAYTDSTRSYSFGFRCVRSAP
jgi:formylglycine-generating enzyme required for sulfatase activity